MNAKHGIRVLAGLLVTAAVALTSVAAQTPQLTVSQPSANKALIHIYRRDQHLYPQQPFIFVNNYLLAWLRKGTFATIEVPPGLVVVSVSAISLGFTKPLQLPDTKGYWTTLPGCDMLDSSQLAYNPPALLDSCESAVSDLIRQCGVHVDYLGCVGAPGCLLWKVTSVPDCNWKLQGLPAQTPYLLTLARDVHKASDRAAAGQPEPKAKLDSRHTMDVPLRFQAEAGKTYYVRYSTHQAWGRLELVSEETGVKEVEGLEPSLNPNGALPEPDDASGTSKTPAGDDGTTPK